MQWRICAPVPVPAEESAEECTADHLEGERLANSRLQSQASVCLEVFDRSTRHSCRALHMNNDQSCGWGGCHHACRPICESLVTTSGFAVFACWRHLVRRRCDCWGTLTSSIASPVSAEGYALEVSVAPRRPLPPPSWTRSTSPSPSHPSRGCLACAWRAPHRCRDP